MTDEGEPQHIRRAVRRLRHRRWRCHNQNKAANAIGKDALV